MKMFLNILLAILGCGGMVFALVMFIMAIRFGELGRVVFYFVITLLFGEMTVLAVLRLVHERGRK